MPGMLAEREVLPTAIYTGDLLKKPSFLSSMPKSFPSPFNRILRGVKRYDRLVPSFLSMYLREPT